MRRELGLNPDARLSGPKEQAIAKMMVNVHRTFAEPLSEDTLCSWHAMVMKGRDLRDAGRYRTGDEAVEIVSGPGARKAHFEAPPRVVWREMARFVKWFNRTAPGGGRSYRR